MHPWTDDLKSHSRLDLSHVDNSQMSCVNRQSCTSFIISKTPVTIRVIAVGQFSPSFAKNQDSLGLRSLDPSADLLAYKKTAPNLPPTDKKDAKINFNLGVWRVTLPSPIGEPETRCENRCLALACNVAQRAPCRANNDDDKLKDHIIWELCWGRQTVALARRMTQIYWSTLICRCSQLTPLSKAPLNYFVSWIVSFVPPIKIIGIVCFEEDRELVDDNN